MPITFSKHLLSNFAIVFFINLLFFLITIDNPLYSDDYGTIVGTKLYNLVHNRNFTIIDFFTMRGDGHFSPIFYFYNQFFPDNPSTLHFIIVFIFALLSILIFLLSYELTRNLFLSNIISILFTINYSISIKPLMWNVFHSHITNAFTGFLSILFFLYFLNKFKNNIIYLFLYLIFIFLTVFNSESGLVYPIILLFIYYFYFDYKNNFIVNNFLIIFPFLMYFFATYYFSGDIAPLLENRIRNYDFPNNYVNFNLYDQIHFSRSRQAPRELIVFVIRIIDNVLSSFNLSSLENFLKYIFSFNKNTIKQSINLYFIIIFFLSSFIIFFIIFFKIIKIIFRKEIFKFFLLYLLLLFIYVFIFNRIDICIALAFPSAVIYANFLVFCYEKYIIRFITLTLIYVLPSILYFLTSFEYVYEMLPRSKIIELSIIHNNNLDSPTPNYSVPYFVDYIYVYYYENYENNKTYLSQFKDLSFFEFEEIFVKLYPDK